MTEYAPEQLNVPAAEDLLSIAELGFPRLEELPPELTDESKWQMLYFLTQHAIDENQVPQKLSRIIQASGPRQPAVSSPEFSAAVYHRRLDDASLLTVPSLLHLHYHGNGDTPGFGATIPLWPDFSLDTGREMVFFMNGQNSLENAGPILKSAALKINEIITSPTGESAAIEEPTT